PRRKRSCRTLAARIPSPCDPPGQRNAGRRPGVSRWKTTLVSRELEPPPPGGGIRAIPITSATAASPSTHAGKQRPRLASGAPVPRIRRMDSHNLAYVEALYGDFLNDPDSVP